MMQNTIVAGGQTIEYSAEVERFEIALEADSPGATYFCTSYVRTNDERNSQRPVLFVFNGGPGSSSVWTHLGIGPRRIADADSLSPRMTPPFKLVDNEETPLDVVDLVFMDPPGTGYSRLADGVEPESFFGVQQDAQAALDVIQQWVRRHRREQSPRFIAGESYGTLRAARIAKLANGGPMLRGLTRAAGISGAITLGPGLSLGEQGWTGDVKTALELTTLVRTARYHGISDGTSDHEATAYAHDVLLPALSRGTALDTDTKRSIAERVGAMIGIQAEQVLAKNLRIEISDFARVALASSGKTVGAYDSRFTLASAGAGADPVADDPAMGQYAPQFAGLIESYLRDELGYKTDDEYRAIDFRITMQHWSYDGHKLPQSGSFSEFNEALRRNPRFELLIGAGEFDLVTTAVGAEFATSRVEHDRSRVHFRLYPSGHMPYLGAQSRQQLAGDLRSFISRLSKVNESE